MLRCSEMVAVLRPSSDGKLNEDTKHFRVRIVMVEGLPDEVGSEGLISLSRAMILSRL